MKFFLFILFTLLLSSCKPVITVNNPNFLKSALCSAGNVRVGGVCVTSHQEKVCTIQPANSTGGEIESDDGGVTWGSCTGFSCTAAYRLSGGSCVANTAPVATAASFYTNINTTHNGTVTGTDANSDTLTFTKVSDPSHGTVTITAATGDFTYTPTTSYQGADSFTFKANDGTADSTTKTISIQVGCPTGYTVVPANATLGVSTFCVMINEAIETAYGSGVVTAVAASSVYPSPWLNQTVQEAKDRCRAIGSNYDLISNPEWMTIARDAEAVASNWSSGVVGTGTIVKGNTDSAPGSILGSPTIGVTDPYDGTGNSAGSGWDQRRTITLSNGSVLWDFSGNTGEWVDWAPNGTSTVTPAPYTASCDHLSKREIYDVAACAAPYPSATYMPLNPAGKSSYGSTYGLGQVLGNSNSIWGYTQRGGNAVDEVFAGMFAVNSYWGNSASETDYLTGFRCVYRP